MARLWTGTLKPSSDLDTHTLLYREFRQYWRGCSYALGVCDELCAGWMADSGVGDNSCGLLLWGRAGDGSPLQR